MMLEKNIAALAKHQPLFILPEQAEDDSGFELCVDAKGNKNIKCIHKGNTLYIKGNTLYIHDEHDALSSAKEQTAQIELTGGGLIVSFGLGMGYEAREIIKKMDKGTNFIIMEPSPEIMDVALKNADITDIVSAPNVHLIMYADKQAAITYMQRFINISNYKNLAVFVLKPYVSLYFEKARDLLFVTDDFRSSFEISEATMERFTSLWQKNAVLNAKYYMQSYLVGDLFGKFRGIPAIIVSAGPSLTKNIRLLKGLSDRCLIVSVDTAIKPLLAHGVKPHFVVSLDTQDIVLQKFSGVIYDDIPLIYIPTSSPPVLNNHSGIKIISMVQDNFYRNLMEALSKNTRYIEMGGSVSTSAFSFAQLAECDPIVLVGQDLAFTNMKSHAEGTAFEAEIIPRSDYLIVNAADGGTVYTDRTLLTYITWFQTYVASDTSGREYINATEGGAKILGFADMSLQEVIDTRLPAGGVDKLVAETLEGVGMLDASEKKFVRNSYKDAISFIESIRVDAKTASAQLTRIAMLLRKPSPNINAVNAAYGKIAGFERRMKQNSDKLELLSITLSPIAEKLNKAYETAEFANDVELRQFAAESYANYYGEIGARCEELLPLLKETFKGRVD